MRILMTGLLIGGLLTACGGDEAPAPAPTTPEVKAPEPVEPVAPAAPEFNAEATFKTTCAPCHGEGGAGDGAAAAALNPKPANFNDPAFWAERDDAHIHKVIKEGGASVGKSPLMAPWGGQFNDEQIDQLVAYLKTTFKPAE
ncbi:MAG: c-type cytochrome [Alphaproteobacteria bacterium]|nr:c-type cytochrome [Alphaproteobacteria bacterium]